MPILRASAPTRSTSSPGSSSRLRAPMPPSAPDCWRCSGAMVPTAPRCSSSTPSSAAASNRATSMPTRPDFSPICGRRRSPPWRSTSPAIRATGARSTRRRPSASRRPAGRPRRRHDAHAVRPAAWRTGEPRHQETSMDFDLPQDLADYLAELDDFIEREIQPLQEADDNQRFFDHRREWARTDFERGGLPREEWEALLAEAKRRADVAGHLRFALPRAYGGRDGSNLWMAVIREHLAARGLGLHNDLQNEHSIVANHPFVLIFRDFGTPQQQAEFIPGMLDHHTHRVSFGLTEPAHGSDATHMDTVAVRETRGGVPGFRIDGEKMWITGMHVASHCAVFARTSGKAGDARGISCLLVPRDTPGLEIEEYLWTFNMPTDHPRISFRNVW